MMLHSGRVAQNKEGQKGTVFCGDASMAPHMVALRARQGEQVECRSVKSLRRMLPKTVWQSPPSRRLPWCPFCAMAASGTMRLSRQDERQRLPTTTLPGPAHNGRAFHGEGVGGRPERGTR